MRVVPACLVVLWVALAISWGLRLAAAPDVQNVVLDIVWLGICGTQAVSIARRGARP